MLKNKIKVHNLFEFESWVTKIAQDFSKRQLIRLCGPMGAGKTQFVTSLVRCFGGDEVSSPTFSIHNHYLTSKGSIEHIDLYRIKDDEDLESTGFWDLFSSSEGIVIVEWADRLEPSVWPLDWDQIIISIEVQEEARMITTQKIVPKCSQPNKEIQSQE